MPIQVTPLGILIVLSSPSGGGKSSICKALLESDPNLEYSISVTSRPPRGDEVNGRDYEFVSVEEFHNLIAQDAFYEWAKVHGNFYGTRKSRVDEKLARGKDVVLDLDVVGGLNLKKANSHAVLIFVLPPSMDVLEKRLRGRKTDGEEQIQKRLINARNELNFASKYDYAVLNEDLQQTIAAIRRIVDAERHATGNQVIKISDENAPVAP
ncbi:MAG: guanylate kinase [Candidatus Sumerlaeaceae bacterium]|nr:guanylate kinase [Candidatus Sumerlaeaceae bacterium]